MDWAPISAEEIREIINEAQVDMSTTEKRLWEHVSIIPEKWEQEPYGSQGEGFWAVGLIGRSVIWYNDIEEGFNISKYQAYGKIDEYCCNQDDLRMTVGCLNRMIRGDV